MNLDQLLIEYDITRGYTHRLIADLDEDAIMWRPHPNSSAIGWHLGHTAAVNHYMIRNLTAAEPRIDDDLDRLFDSATQEPDRGQLPPTPRTLAYRRAVASSTRRTIAAINTGNVGAPEQLAIIARGMLTSIINHEYQHAKWISEVRTSLDRPTIDTPGSMHLVTIDGYLILDPDEHRATE